jgi:hypothetical protein
MKIITQALCLAILVWPSIAEARMITYPGGVTVMTMNDVDTNTVEGYYTVTPKYAVGVRHDYWRDSKANMDAAQISYLVKRWNNQGSQANFYLHSGVGVAYEDGESQAAVLWRCSRRLGRPSLYTFPISNEFLSCRRHL